jgi:hypothetical protein
VRHFFFSRYSIGDGDGRSPRNLLKFSIIEAAALSALCNQNRFGHLCRSYSLKPTIGGMSNMTVQEDRTGTEAGKLQADLKDVFSKMLSHARRIDMTMTLGDSTEALGQLRELEAYLERGLDVLSRPLDHES